MTTSKTIKAILLVVFCSGLYTGCGNSNKETEKTQNTAVTESPKDEKLHQLEVESSRLRAGGSIKNVELNEGKAKIL